MSKRITKIRLAIATLLFCFASASADTNLYVGQSIECDATFAITAGNYSHSNISWSVIGGYLSAGSTASSSFKRTYTATQYWSGQAIIECTWQYTLYRDDKPRTGSRTWYVSCIDNRVTIWPPSLELNVGETSQVNYTLYNTSFARYAEIYYQSTNSSVVTVGMYDGYVTAVGPGDACINVYSRTSSEPGVCRVHVNKVDPTDVSLPSTANTYVGETTTLTPTLYPSVAQTTYTWYSRDPNIATVSNGVVTGRDEGTARIYCITANGLQSRDCDVSVKYRVPTDIKLSSSTLYVPIGQNKTLTYSVTPSNARYSVTWKSEDESVATVSQSGVVTGIKEGTTYIKVTTDNGKYARCQVTVPPNPSSISLPGKISLCYGKSRTLKFDVYPADAFHEITWTSSDDKPLPAKARAGGASGNTKVVSVSSNGTVKALRPGTAVVTATTQNGKTASCIVEVPEVNYMFYVWTKSGEKIGYSLNEHPKSKYDGDAFLFETDKVSVTYPADDIRKFTMADESIDPIPSGIEMDGELMLHVTESAHLDYKLLPLDYDIETSLTWKSDNISCVTVANGTITALAPGEANITLTAGNGCKAECHVTVPEPDYNLVVWLRNGETNLFRLAEHPVAEYKDGSFILRTSQTEVTYDAASVRKFTLQDGDYIDAIPSMEIPRQNMHYGSGTVEISNGKPNSPVVVYSSGGVTIDRMRLDANGYLQFSTAGYSSGIYIIKTDKTTFKILKK